MQSINYHNLAKDFGARKSLGQNFLINEGIAAIEAKYAQGLNVIELGPGLGILTRELCRSARRVVSVEKDGRLFDFLKANISSDKLHLINADFFSLDIEKIKPIDIMISNIPYNLSSKTIYWLAENSIPAVLCIQKEFAGHMVAKPGTSSYSKLSVLTHLSFRVHSVREVHAGNFYPMPRVDSSIIYLIPRSEKPDAKLAHIISSIMNHKKKRLRNAIMDAYSDLKISKALAKEVAQKFNASELRPFHMSPEKILEIALELNSLINQKE